MVFQLLFDFNDKLRKIRTTTPGFHTIFKNVLGSCILIGHNFIVIINIFNRLNNLKIYTELLIIICKPTSRQGYTNKLYRGHKINKIIICFTTRYCSVVINFKTKLLNVYGVNFMNSWRYPSNSPCL